ncbi:hypothetical protein [Sphaerisporangium rhizosphaerae]|uniref:Type II toxin-antitoxin system RelE/ParE family toxin n=1 Tax=Sphaerisporangium rhizosphaerae TaxID=2269375 RepID=A0ABW2P6D4_9ACTN
MLRPKPWVVRFADRKAAEGWQHLLRQALENLDRAWVAITSDPRHVDSRQHPLKGALGTVKVGGEVLEQWQYEATAGGRIWYAIDDAQRTLWITRAGTGHPKPTDRRGH